MHFDNEKHKAKLKKENWQLQWGDPKRYFLFEEFFLFEKYTFFNTRW